MSKIWLKIENALTRFFFQTINVAGSRKIDVETLFTYLQFTGRDVRGSRDQFTSSPDHASCLDGGGDRIFLTNNNKQK